MSRIGRISRKQTQMCMQEVVGEVSGKGQPRAEGEAELWRSADMVSAGNFRAWWPFRCPRWRQGVHGPVPSRGQPLSVGYDRVGYRLRQSPLAGPRYE